MVWGGQQGAVDILGSGRPVWIRTRFHMDNITSILFLGEKRLPIQAVLGIATWDVLGDWKG